ncbi:MULTISPECIES: hypothetical protein [Mycobacteriales]|uniref:Nuclear transport factor 2 family protein n=1 Tax=Gordonia rubripertincta TaxID=36822 RepID=A0ABT4N3C5_GORRU|nr:MULTISPECIES: hypothetical protein [Mycobacteriales]MCZ4553465.1 hypothetical protein [Gordonia rubripertincta]
MSHLMLHPVHHVPVRQTVVLSMAVLLANLALVWFALSIRSDPADDATAIRTVVAQQIDALNARDAAALQLTYCSRQGEVAGLIIEALGPRTANRTLRVARITDIQRIGSTMATARVQVEFTGADLAAIELRPDTVSTFRKGETGWQMCDPGDGSTDLLHV